MDERDQWRENGSGRSNTASMVPYPLSTSTYLVRLRYPMAVEIWPYVGRPGFIYRGIHRIFRTLMDLLAARPYSSSHGLAKAMDPRGDLIYPTQASRFSELSSALGEGKRYRDNQVRECVGPGVSTAEGICVSPTSAVSH